MPDWIEQDEFERRRSLFGATGRPPSGGGGRPSTGEAPSATTTTRGSPKATKAAAEGSTEVLVTVSGLAGDVLWGPAAVAAGTTVGAFLADLASALPRRAGAMRLLRGQERLSEADLLQPSPGGPAAGGGVHLTLVYVDPPPEGARVVGDLAVWTPSAPRGSEAEEEAAAGGPRPNPKLRAQKRNQTQVLVGRDGRTRETVYHKMDIGRCNYMTLRFGRKGLYYNSSSHGTATFALQVYGAPPAGSGSGGGGSDPVAGREDDGRDSDDDERCSEEAEVCEEMRAIIPGPHCRGGKDRGALIEARRLADSLFVAAGRKPPVVTPSVLRRWPPQQQGGEGGGSAAARHVRAWQELLCDLGVDQPAPTLWALLYMPWLDSLGSMNETDLCAWGQQGYPDLLADMPEDSRQRFQQGIEEHY